VQLVFESDLGMQYASRDDSAWRFESLEPGSDPSIAVDPSGVPWIAYRDVLDRVVVATRRVP